MFYCINNDLEFAKLEGFLLLKLEDCEHEVYLNLKIQLGVALLVANPTQENYLRKIKSKWFAE